MAKAKKTLAFVVYPGISLLELVGNRTLLGDIMKLRAGYEPVVVGARLEAIPTDTPLSIIPQKTFAEVPHPDGLVVIGGGAGTIAALDNSELLTYVRRSGQNARWVASTSTGSLLLAAAGLLEGREATTHWAYQERLEKFGARYKAEGWITDGKFTTAAGVSDAIDMAIGLGAKMTNRATAQLAQLMIEYDPDPPLGRLDWKTFDRQTLAPLMTLERAPDNSTSEQTIAFVLYPGLTVFDLAGPLQVFSALSRLAPHIRPQVVAEQVGPVKTDIGVMMVPNCTFADLPHPYAFFVPGGDTATLKAMSNPAIRSYIQTAAQDATWIVSVCTGALILAGVGLLEGRDVTTHWAYVRILKQLGAKYVQKRWTANGNIVNSAGVSAGIDMALYMASKLTDEETARQVQWLIQYDPRPPFGGIDYSHYKLLPRLVRFISGLRAYLYTPKVRRLTRQEAFLHTVPSTSWSGPEHQITSEK
ncbi:MAG TPA: DJ-1/PfpI family protein [Chloroflexia bacterium]|nr:DJ-1/PfpI family protein [Chloroflexia bacterium]